MKRICLFFIFSLCVQFLMAQSDSADVAMLAAKLDKALLDKDSLALVQLLDKDLTYGHSSGWIETKLDVIKDVTSGYMVYTKIESTGLRITTDKDWATVRTTTTVEGLVDGKKIHVDLHVLQVWIKSKKHGWRMVARQGTKISV